MAEYIEREALREILDGWRDAHADVDDVYGCDLLEDVICEVDAQTAADVAQVVRGRWIPHDRVFGDDFLVCSKCQFVSEDRSTRRYYHYCPHCGAKMDGERKDGGDG